MFIVKRLSDIPTLHAPCALTLGNFDGIHRGHQFLLHTLKESGGTSAVVTFSNHPSHILTNTSPARSICTLDHKLHLLKEAGITLVILLEFTGELANQPFDLFLTSIYNYLPFISLVLGEGAAFGKKKEGTQPRVEQLGAKMNFTTQYLKKLSVDGETISSGKIRCSIQQKDLVRATHMLGRPYSIYAHAHNSVLDIQQRLCLPPAGDYPIIIKQDSNTHPGTLSIDPNGQLSFQCTHSFPTGHIEIILLCKKRGDEKIAPETTL